MKVLDNFITDKSLLDEIRSDKSFFPESMGDDEKVNYSIHQYHDPESPYFSPYMFWDGWWRSPANTLKKRVIQEIWKDNLPLPENEISGFEYWAKTFKPGQYLGLHIDEDSHLYKEQQIFNGPTIGCVYYPDHESIDGGFLELHEFLLDDGSKSQLERGMLDSVASPIEKRERIAFKPNRLIIFDAGHILHNTTPAENGVRRVLVVNVWSEDKKPLGLQNNGFYLEK